MAKIVKYCSTCDEGYAEKFGFCPTCGSTLEAFEMNPIEAAVPMVSEPVESIKAEPAVPEFIADEISNNESTDTMAGAANFEPSFEDHTYDEGSVALNSGKGNTEPLQETPSIKEIPLTTPIYAVSKAQDADSPRDIVMPRNIDDSFHVTVIEEHDGGKRGLLMLGSLGLVLFALISGLVINIFSKDLEIGSINDDMFNALLLDDAPTVPEEIEKPKQKKDDAGGGGGGGKEDPDPVSQGQRAQMMKNPDIAPSARMDRLTNPTLTQRVGIEGPEIKTNIDPNKRYGLPNSNFQGVSDGPGKGGGQGTGIGRGQGPGTGGGFGPGSNGGMGGGSNGGIGTGDGPGFQGGPPPTAAKPKPVGVSQPLSVTSKPKPSYTDAARVAGIQGVVILRVTFRADGSIGDVSTVKGLPNGLTEQAIAAARRMSFQPKKVDGVGQTVVKNVEFTFNMY